MKLNSYITSHIEFLFDTFTYFTQR